MQIKPNHISASLDQRIRDLLQSGRLPRSAIPMEIEDDNPNDFECSTPDGAQFGLNQWDTLSKHEIKAAQDELRSMQSSGGEADKTAAPPAAESPVPAAQPPAAEAANTGGGNES